MGLRQRSTKFAFAPSSPELERAQAFEKNDVSRTTDSSKSHWSARIILLVSPLGAKLCRMHEAPGLDEEGY